MRSLPILALAALLLAGSAAAQQFYKWKDANGVTHYTTTPPPAGQDASRLAVKPGNPEPPVDTSTSTATDPAGATPAGGPGRSADATALRNAACITARGNLSTLQNNIMVSMDKDGDGTMEMLTPEEQDAQIARAQRQVETVCGSTPPG
jgi:hypothetical protein